MNLIDVHCHALPPAYLRFLEEERIDAIALEGFPTPSWSSEGALAFADEAGIDFSVLSLSTPHIHLGNDARACAWAHAINEDLADLCRAHPDRLGFCATLPTPCVEESIAEAAYALDELGALGVKVPSNALGTYLGDPSLAPLFEFLDKRSAPVIIHPTAPQEVPQGCFTAGPKPLFEYVADTTRTVLDLIATGTLARYPNVRVVVPHCGSFLPLLAQRLSGISRVLVPAGVMAECDVADAFGRLWFDVAGDVLPVWLPALLKVADPCKVMYGSDFPYTPAPAILARDEVLFASEELAPVKEAVMHQNAERLFGLGTVGKRGAA